MQIKFLYFDLGKVLVDFSTEQMLEQIGTAAGMSAAAAGEIIFAGGLLRQYETGRLSTAQFYEAFCTAAGSRPSYDVLAAATSAIFSLHLSTLPLVTQLQHAGYLLGILSNTCPLHWEYCLGRYRILSEGFAVHALSFRIGAMKPEAAIFHAAAELAGFRPEEIFFVDDIAEHVVGARAVGFDAVQYTTATALSGELRRRGIRFNY